MQKSAVLSSGQLLIESLRLLQRTILGIGDDAMQHRIDFPQPIQEQSGHLQTGNLTRMDQRCQHRNFRPQQLAQIVWSLHIRQCFSSNHRAHGGNPIRLQRPEDEGGCDGVLDGPLTHRCIFVETIEHHREHLCQFRVGELKTHHCQRLAQSLLIDGSRLVRLS